MDDVKKKESYGTNGTRSMQWMRDMLRCLEEGLPRRQKDNEKKEDKEEANT